MDTFKRTKVYFNSHRRNFSCLDGGGKVVHRSDEIYLTNVKFQVNEAGRRKVLATGRKNVHAFVCGNFSHKFEVPPTGITRVWYNPKICGQFMDNRCVPISPASSYSKGVLYMDEGEPFVYVW